MYQNHFVQFSRLFLWALGMGYVNLLWHSLSLPYNYFGAQGLGTNGKCIRYASFRFVSFKLTQPALQKISLNRSNCAFTKIEAVLIDVYLFNSSPLSSSFFKCAFLLLKSVVWCRRTKNVCERHVQDPISLSGLRLRESILNCD